mgnify:CR=1 FL=1
MLLQSVSFESTGYFSKIFTDYVNQKPELQPFYGKYPTIENLGKQAEERTKINIDRVALVNALHKQYDGIKINESVRESIDRLLQANSFTVTTGHQLCLFTGPVYFIYKIVTTINLAKKLNEQFPDKKFVPVYWMASEDHDFEEVNHFHLFGRTHTWESTQTGAVGDFDTKGINKIFEELKDKLPAFEEAYLTGKKLAQATRCLVNELFSKYGLVIIDGNDRSLKSLFSDFIKKELSGTANFDAVTETNKDLDSLGYIVQVHPREINLFYLDKGKRERIVKENGDYKVLNTELSFTENEILGLVNTNPEFFSPNVVLRPVYQEVILPNIAYVGGPGELAYWLQLKSMFENLKISFPVLVPRNFALVVNGGQNAKIQKLGIEVKDLFLDEHSLKKRFLEIKNTTHWNENVYKYGIEATFNEMKAEVEKLDKSLSGFVDAQKAEVFKILEGINKKIRKTAEHKEEEQIGQLLNLKSKLFPSHGLQERYENVLNFMLPNPDFIENLTETFEPLKFEFNIITV